MAKKRTYSNKPKINQFSDTTGKAYKNDDELLTIVDGDQETDEKTINRTDFEDKKIIKKPEEPLPPIEAVEKNRLQVIQDYEYHKNPDINAILKAYWLNREKPDFKPYDVKIDLYMGKRVLLWNGKRIEP